MMKKIVAWMLCLIMGLSGAAALAEGAESQYSGELTVPERFTIKWVAPEDYELVGIDAGNPDWIGDPGFMIAQLVPHDPDSDMPVVNISIARDELLSEVKRLNDLDDAALSKIEDTFRDEDTVEISYMETAYGTKLMVVRETAGDTEYVDFYTIYMGYEIEMVLTRSEELDTRPITDEEIAMVVRFMSDLSFEPIAAE